MTPPVLLEAAPGLDPALPGLAAALSAHPPGTGAEDVCRVLSVDWAPRRRCRVVHEVRSPGRPATLTTSEVTPAGTTVRGLSGDAALPGLTDALDPSLVRQRLADLCPAPGPLCRITPVAYRPGARAVVAYDVGTGAERRRFYAKLLAEGCDRYAASAAAIATEARRRAEPCPVPEVVALWPDLGAVVQSDAAGPVLSALLRDRSVPRSRQIAYAGRLGRLLACVHSTPPPAAAPRWRTEDELRALEGLLAPAWSADPAAGRSLAALLDRLADAVPDDSGPVLSHGAFRTGQVIAGDGRLTLLDLDTVSTSDAARDLGNALAYLSWADVRGAVPPGLHPALQRALLAGYDGARTAVAADALAWWSAAAMAKIAGRRFRALATTEWRSVPALLDRAAARLDPASGAIPAPRRGGRLEPPVDPLDLDRMTEILRATPFLRPADRVVGARQLAEAPGRRRVVRYRVAGPEPGAPAPLIGKLYAERHHASIGSENLRLLGEEVFAATPELAVPGPVCFVPALRMLLYREVPGTPLDRLPAGAAAIGAGLAGAWLARLHASGTGLARRLDLVHEVADAEVEAARVGDAVPAARPVAHALADRLATAAADLPAAPEVPIHKDFHLGHVLAVGGNGPAPDGPAPDGVVVLDLDEARMGDPALDVAHATAYLDVSAWPGAGAARGAFLARYGPLPGPSPELRSAFFAARTSMKIAKQLVTGRGPVPVGDDRARTAAVLAVLRRGLACLDG